MYDVNKYFLIDKSIVKDNDTFIFDIYGKNSFEDELIQVYEKAQTLTEKLSKTILSYKYLYVENTHRDIYDEYYKNSKHQTIIPKNTQKFYEDIALKIDKLFENPERIENLEQTKEIVSNMVSIVLEESFTISSFISILEYEYYNHTHSLNVCVYSLCLGKQLNLTKPSLEELGISAILHDIGKTKIDQSIINKDGKLNEVEFKEVMKHPFYGTLLAKKLGINNIKILEGIKYHHEKMDGTGYPDGLFETQIPLYAKIIGTCDIFDALTTKKTYQDSVSTFDTLIMMKKEMSKQLDSKIINAFIEIFRNK